MVGKSYQSDPSNFRRIAHIISDAIYTALTGEGGYFDTRIAFVGTDGFSPERGLTTRFVEGAQVASLMSERAEETWLVADSTKFGQAGFVSFLPLHRLTGIITDSDLPAEAVKALQEHTRVCLV